MSEVLKRAMFAMPLSKSARNSGILQGFEDDEEESGPDAKMDESLEEMPIMARTPQNPEILMNNLRGDIRSTDSRYQELAEMVGDEAAYGTPPEVLAMLQPVLAQQQQGIAALGQAGPMPQMPGPGPAMPPGMPPGVPPGGPGMPPGPPPPDGGGIAALMAAGQGGPGPAPGGPPPGGPAPQQFAHGGYVQHFKYGSDEEGVTPAAVYPPELTAAAQDWLKSQLATQPRAIPSLEASMQARLPMYQQLLGMGRSKEDMQTQLLLDIASRGLGLAGNVDEQGRPLRGSFASRLAQSARTLPNTVMALSAEQRKGELAAKQLALQASEKEINEIRDLNAKDIEVKRKIFTDIIKEQAKAAGQKESSIFGKGAWHWAVVNRPGFLADYAAGKTTPDQDNLIQSAITIIETPRTEFRTDPVTGQTTQVQVPAQVPQFVKDAQAARARLMPTSGAQGARVELTQGTPDEQIAWLQKAVQGATSPEDRANLKAELDRRLGSRPAAQGAAPAATPPAAAPAGAAAAPTMPPAKVPSKAPPVTYSASDPTMFNLASMGTGAIPVSSAFIARVPIVGELVDADQNIQANTFLSNAANQLNRSLATNPKFSEGERKQIVSELQLSTRLIDRPEAYQQRLIGLDALLVQLRNKAYRAGYQNPNLGPETIRAERTKVEEIDGIRDLIGVPIRITTKADWDALDPGTPYILNNRLMTKKQKAADAMHNAPQVNVGNPFP